jgi:hypothetical protein
MNSPFMVQKIPSRSWLAILSLLMVLSVWVCLSGCTEPLPAGEQAQPTVTPAGETVQYEGSQPTAPATPVPEMGVEESPRGYIARSFGLVPYETPPNYRITYIDSAAVRDSTGAVFIQGRLKNEGPADLRYLHVTFHLFDSSGNVLGNVEATIEYFPAGMTWHYSTSSYKTDFYQYYQLAGIVAQ